jgi:DNA mismatch repair protein MutL
MNDNREIHLLDQSVIEKIATSKIASADELFSISTMGFRGEALASIAAVSRITVTSSNTEDSLGHTISSEGGELSDIAPQQRTRGTTVTCRDLFFNVPARKKFMKSRKAERMAVMRVLEQLVISFPAIHFSCTAEGKRSFDMPQVDTPHMRIAQVAGTEFAKKLIHCQGETGDMSVEVYITDPQDAKARPRFQSLYVNLRRVDNDSVVYAIREAFSRFITSQLRPSWFCFLDVEPSRVDVNIHPTKQKIKFDDEKNLFSFIFKTVYSDVSGRIAAHGEFTQRAGHVADNNAPAAYKDFTGKQKGFTGGRDKGIVLQEEMTNNKEYTSPLKQSGDSEQMSLSFLSVLGDRDAIRNEIEKQGKGTDKLTGENWNLIPCYQIHKMFILAPIKNGIIIIDQHAAHERILYEEALEDLKKGRSESQRLLFPVTFNMSTAEKDVVISSRDSFNALGFDVQDFGGQTIAVSAMPAAGFLKSSNIEEAIREIVQNLVEEKDKSLLAEPQKRFAASFACGSAIKFGQELKQGEMNLLINSLFATKDPYICPHGRPTLIRMSIEELMRRFLR